MSKRLGEIIGCKDKIFAVGGVSKNIIFLLIFPVSGPLKNSHNKQYLGYVVYRVQYSLIYL